MLGAGLIGLLTPTIVLASCGMEIGGCVDDCFNFPKDNGRGFVACLSTLLTGAFGLIINVYLLFTAPVWIIGWCLAVAMFGMIVGCIKYERKLNQNSAN